MNTELLLNRKNNKNHIPPTTTRHHSIKDFATFSVKNSDK